MSFLYPMFLFLIPLVILPILLFIGFKGKKKEIEFSTLFLLRKEEFRDERHRQKLRMWLLIILRMLMIASIILLLSRPRYFGKKWHNVYFDASISMKGTNSRKVLNKFLDVFGKNRVSIINTHDGHLFLLDTSKVPNAEEEDIFYTDGRVSYLPNCKIMCSKLYKNDAWVFADSIYKNKVFLNVNTPKEVYLKVYNLKKVIDSQFITPDMKKYIYTLRTNDKYLWFYLDYKDRLMENNYFFIVFSKERIPVRLSSNSHVLSIFFSTYPFYLDTLSENCVFIDTIDPYCKNQVVFFKTKKIRSYLKDSKKVYFGKWNGYILRSGIRTFLLFDFYPYDTSSEFYDIAFVKSFYDTLINIFTKSNKGKNIFIHQLNNKECKGPIRGPYNIATGFYVCKNDTVSVNVDKIEYLTPSICREKKKYSFSDLSSILIIQRFLIYFLILLFILETFIIYIF